jgi:thiamine pyrophosphate-dependent acetolactate synthase large subunit-like protein
VTRATQVADAIGGRLARLGVDTVFGVVGSGNFVVTNALIAGGAAFHAARHEGGAIGMADGWARVTGRVGVCSVHQGPGLTNTMTGWRRPRRRAPPCSSSPPTRRPPRAVELPDRPARPRRIRRRGGRADPLAGVGGRRRGPRAATRARRARPVVLMLPIDLSARTARRGRDGRSAAAAARCAPPADAAVSAAAGVLAAAERPVLIAGRGAVLSRARDAIEALGARTGALLATSAMANGLFGGLPYALGISGGFASPLAAGLLRQADAIVAFGATLNHWTTRHGTLFAPDAPVVAVDLDTAAIGGHGPVAVAVVGDAAATAGVLDAYLAARGHAATGWRTPERASQIAAGGWAGEPFEDASGAEGIDPRALSRALDALLPAERTVAVDSGHFLGWPSMYLRVPDARSWVFANGFQAVGLGLGCAIGAAVARPGRVTVAAVGDGGLFMALPELETAVRLGLRLLVVVYDDRAYGAEVHHFAPMAHDVATVRFPDADLAALARAAGAEGVTVRSTADLGPVAEWLRDGRGPLLLDAKVHPGVAADWLKDAFRGG